MKKILLFSFIALFFVSFTSCDSNIGKAEDLTEQFINSVNNNDKVAINSLYPEIKNFTVMKMPKSIQSEGISVDKDTSGLYVATIDNSKGQKFYFKQKGESNLEIVNSYAFMELDSVCVELGIKTGVPIKEINDKELDELFSENGADEKSLVKYLRNYCYPYMDNYLQSEGATWSWNNSSLTYHCYIRNTSNEKINGSEYKVLVKPTVKSNGTVYHQHTFDGTDLVPGEIFEAKNTEGSLVNYARRKNLTFYTEIIYLEPIQARLLKYAPLKDTDYTDFVAYYKEENEEAAEEETETEVNEEDIETEILPE